MRGRQVVLSLVWAQSHRRRCGVEAKRGRGFGLEQVAGPPSAARHSHMQWIAPTASEGPVIKGDIHLAGNLQVPVRLPLKCARVFLCSKRSKGAVVTTKRTGSGELRGCARTSRGCLARGTWAHQVQAVRGSHSLRHLNVCAYVCARALSLRAAPLGWHAPASHINTARRVPACQGVRSYHHAPYTTVCAVPLPAAS